MNRFLIALPLVTLFYLGYLFYQNQQPPEVPALINRPMPAFELEEIIVNGYGDVGMFSHSDLPNRTVMINVFASWCSTCLIEHDALMEISQTHGIPIYGIAYRDKRETVIRMLKKIGNPYTRIGNDPEGAEMVKWRVTATPESWIIDKNGRIRYHHRGYLGIYDVTHVILPLIAKIEAEQPL